MNFSRPAKTVLRQDAGGQYYDEMIIYLTSVYQATKVMGPNANSTQEMDAAVRLRDAKILVVDSTRMTPFAVFMYVFSHWVPEDFDRTTTYTLAGNVDPLVMRHFISDMLIVGRLIIPEIVLIDVALDDTYNADVPNFYNLFVVNPLIGDDPELVNTTGGWGDNSPADIFGLAVDF